MVADVPNWVFSLFSFVSFIIVLIPLPWHLEAWNTGTCMFMVWTAVASLNSFINSVVWNSDVVNRAPVWCDISSQIILASSVALPASCLCISRRMYEITSIQSVTTTRSQKRRKIIVDLAIGLGIPIFVLALHPIVQADRFMIYEKIGCLPATLNSPLAYGIYNSWVVIIGLVSTSYAARSFYRLSIRRAQFKELLSVHKNLNSSRYLRLMALCCVDIVFTVPIGCFSIYLNATTAQLQAWQTNFSTIIQVPADEWQTSSISIFSVEMYRWTLVLCAFVFIAFFGFADEARKNYRLAYASIEKRVGLSTTGTWTASGTNPNMLYSGGSTTIPAYTNQNMAEKRDSLTSFSPRMSLPDIADIGGTLADVKREVPPLPSTTLPATAFKGSLSSVFVGLDSVPLPAHPEATLDMSTPPPGYIPDAAMHDLTRNRI